MIFLHQELGKGSMGTFLLLHVALIEVSQCYLARGRTDVECPRPKCLVLWLGLAGKLAVV